MQAEVPEKHSLVRTGNRLLLAFALAATAVAGPWLLRNAVQNDDATALIAKVSETTAPRY